MQRMIFEAEHEQFRDSVRQFIARYVRDRMPEWERAGIVDRQVYRDGAKFGLLGFAVPERYGGGGVSADFRYNAVVNEEMAAAAPGGPAFSLQNDIISPYLLELTNDEQRDRWLPRFCAGELIAAVAMTEPEAGSDLKGIRTSARRDGDDWIVSGAKTFISSGFLADLVIVVARTDGQASASKAFTLFAVEDGMAGFSRGRKLDKLGLHAQDTAELSFDDVRVPASNVVGEVGRGFVHLMHNLPMERLSIAVNAVAASRAVFDATVQHAQTRVAFGQPIGSFQANRFTLAELDTELDIARVYVDRCIAALNNNALSGEDAAKAKWWTTELQQKVVYNCQQLYGGYGYVTEYPVAKAYADARIQTIYGGSTQIMKEIIGRSLGV
jgi:alkylation response protein AidB-like acyl-CoA dehydrogenase